MGINHTKGKIKQWAKISKEDRFKIMSERVKKGWSKKSKKERKARSLLMVKARLNKLIKT